MLQNKLMKKSLTFIFLVFFQSFVFSQSGTFDTQFFDGGKFIFFENPDVSPNSSADDMIMDNNGDFLVCGQSSNSGNNNPAYIMKFSANGQLVENFGNGGIAYFAENSTVQGGILAIKQLNNGNFVILTGSVFGSPNSTSLSVLEIGQNGEVIENFGNGSGTFTIPGNISSARMEISPQGKIWVFFNKINLPNTFTTSSNVYAVQFNQDGTLNTTFSNAGLFEFGQDETDERVFGLAFDNNENAYLSGGYRAGSGFGVLGEVFILGVQSTGQVKSDFAQNGVFRFNDNVASYGSQSIVFRNDELVFCGFRFQSNEGEKAIIGKITTQGLPVVSFGNAGIALLNQINSTFVSIAIDNVGRIVALGSLTNSDTNDDDIIVAKFDENGELQTNFGSNGLTQPWDLNNNEDKPKRILLSNDGLGIIASGRGFSVNGGSGGNPNLQTGDYGFVLKYNYNQPSSIVENSNTSFLLFPNPASDLISIVSQTKIVDFLIFDVSGKQIDASNFNFQNNILDISNLSNGTYVLQLGATVHKKFVVCRE